MAQPFQITTKLWRRSQNSHATTIPKEILAIKGAPTGEDAVVRWSINQETGEVEVKFETEDNE
jgi:hypothetical protein